MVGVSQSRKLRLAVLISGRGSNLQSIIDACRIDGFPAEIVVVISNKSDAYGLVRAQNAGITTQVISHKDYETKSDFEADILSSLDHHKVDLVCLAGFMRLLSPTFITPWEGRIINIHPSLLPKYKGLDTHARAIEAGDLEAGCTVHYVTTGMDEGDVIVQRSVPIQKDDTAQSLAERILPEEHIAYPEAIRIMASKLTPFF